MFENKEETAYKEKHLIRTGTYVMLQGLFWLLVLVKIDDIILFQLKTLVASSRRFKLDHKYCTFKQKDNEPNVLPNQPRNTKSVFFNDHHSLQT